MIIRNDTDCHQGDERICFSVSVPTSVSLDAFFFSSKELVDNVCSSAG